jgi:hypothetical protein
LNYIDSINKEMVMKIYDPEDIEENLRRTFSRKNDPMTELIIRDHFLNKYLIKNEFLDLNDEKLKYVLKTFIKYDFIQNKDLELLINEIRNINFIEYKRTTPWHFSEINVLDSSGKIISYGYCKANFHLINKWGFKSDNRLHRIIYDKESLTVLWANFGYLTDIDINENIETSEKYISHNYNVYNISYIQTHLWIIENPDAQRTKLKGLDNNLLDEYINYICEETINRGHGFIIDIEHAKVADITDLLGNRFFKNGPEWKYSKNTIYYNGITATNITDIITEKNMFKLIIENNTYKNIKKKVIYLDMDYFILYNEKNDKIFLENYILEF